MRLPHLSDEFPEVPVVPLIDVMFTLLTFFIVTSLLIEKNKAIKLNLPKSTTTEIIQAKKKDQVDISVAPDGKFYFNKQPVSREQLIKEVTPLKDDVIIVLSGDENTHYEDITKAMEVIRDAGKFRIGLAADRDEKGATK
ncbi:ExbD/TolR family protein [Anthocerotibacter panamensis]|uniref:ExbD/TolR family protein n=1 Tax=Anthocerotibacter panamensis TaxID=2857077 RepID=UPI001C406BFA|nr:biopolymer transporter ExbD [Anthocerotibacter panamensis]